MSFSQQRFHHHQQQQRPPPPIPPSRADPQGPPPPRQGWVPGGFGDNDAAVVRGQDSVYYGAEGRRSAHHQSYGGHPPIPPRPLPPRPSPDDANYYDDENELDVWESSDPAAAALVRAGRRAVREVARAVSEDCASQRGGIDPERRDRGPMQDTPQYVELAALTAGQIADLCRWHQQQQRRSSSSGARAAPYAPLDPWARATASAAHPNPPMPPISEVDVDRRLEHLYQEIGRL